MPKIPTPISMKPPRKPSRLVPERNPEEVLNFTKIMSKKTKDFWCGCKTFYREKPKFIFTKASTNETFRIDLSLKGAPVLEIQTGMNQWQSADLYALDDVCFKVENRQHRWNSVEGTWQSRYTGHWGNRNWSDSNDKFPQRMPLFKHFAQEWNRKRLTMRKKHGVHKETARVKTHRLKQRMEILQNLSKAELLIVDLKKMVQSGDQKNANSYEIQKAIDALWSAQRECTKWVKNKPTDLNLDEKDK